MALASGKIQIGDDGWLRQNRSVQRKRKPKRAEKEGRVNKFGFAELKVSQILNYIIDFGFEIILPTVFGRFSTRKI